MHDCYTMSLEASGPTTQYTVSGDPPRIDELVYADSQLQRSIADNPLTASLMVYANNPVNSIARPRGTQCETTPLAKRGPKSYDGYVPTNERHFWV